MGQSRFTEGVFFGAIIGASVTYFFGEKIKDYILELNKNSKKIEQEMSPEEKASKVSQTRESIEKDLENLTQMVENQKKGFAPPKSS